MPEQVNHCRTRFDENEHEAQDYLQQCDENPELLELLTTKELGYLGESLAIAHLEEHDMEVVERNYRCRAGEADIVAVDLDSKEVVLIEVKSRRTKESPGSFFPEEAVDTNKQLRYSRIAACYALEHREVRSIRFDVIAITFFSGLCAQVEHIQDAFELDA